MADTGYKVIRDKEASSKEWSEDEPEDDEFSMIGLVHFAQYFNPNPRSSLSITKISQKSQLTSTTKKSLALTSVFE
jgi:hypothetical protein